MAGRKVDPSVYGLSTQEAEKAITPTVLTGANIREKTIPQLNMDATTAVRQTTPATQVQPTEKVDEETSYYDKIYDDTFGKRDESLASSAFTDENGIVQENPPSDPEMRAIYDMGKKADALTQSSLKIIENKYKGLEDEMKQSNVSARASLGQFLAQAGGLKSASGRVILGKVEQDGIKRIQSLQSQEDTARLEVIRAQQDKDYRLLENKLALLKEARDKKFQVAMKVADTLEAKAKEARDANRKEKEDLDKNKFEALKNAVGAPPEIKGAIANATNTTELINAAGDYLQTGTGIIGEYNYYKRDMLARGLTPKSFEDYQTDDANRKISIASAASLGGLSNQQFQRLNTIADNARQDGNIKDFPAIRASYETARSAAQKNDGTGDVVLMRMIAKITDPTTGVRDQEFETFAGAQSTLANFGIKLTTKMWSGDRLNDYGRKSLFQQAQDIYDQRKAAYDNSYEYFKKQAEKTGGSVDDVLPYYVAPTAEIESTKKSIDEFVVSHGNDAFNEELTWADAIAKMYEIPGATEKDIYKYLKANGKI